jgi:hypothetical protein
VQTLRVGQLGKISHFTSNPGIAVPLLYFLAFSAACSLAALMIVSVPPQPKAHETDSGVSEPVRELGRLTR